MSILVFKVPACVWWSTNERVHHYVRARNAREWRDTARVVAVQATRHYVAWQRMDTWSAQALLAWGDRRMRDPHNYAGTVIKACIDGLVDAGVAVADDSDHLLFTSQARHPGDGRGFPPGVYLTVQAAYLTQEAS